MIPVSEDQKINTIGTMSQCLDYQFNNEIRPKWFVSYGALLWYIRDKNTGVKFEQDLDISIFEDSDFSKIERYFTEFGIEKRSEFVNDRNGEPFKMVFGRGVSIDIFMQIKANGYYWHTYDYYGEFRKTPKKGYIFKGVPCELMEGDTWKYSWNERIPDLNFPRLYGHLLDVWYPGWIILDKRFGQSRSTKIVKLNTCKRLKENLK